MGPFENDEAFGRECDPEDNERDSSGVYEGQGAGAEYD